MHVLAPHRTGHDLHLACAVLRDFDSIRPAMPGGEEGGVPTKEALVGEGAVMVLRGVEEHFHDPVHIARGGHEPGCIDAQPPGNG